jgi:hypothetical protein
MNIAKKMVYIMGNWFYSALPFFALLVLLVTCWIIIDPSQLLEVILTSDDTSLLFIIVIATFSIATLINHRKNFNWLALLFVLFLLPYCIAIETVLLYVATGNLINIFNLQLTQQILHWIPSINPSQPFQNYYYVILFIFYILPTVVIMLIVCLYHHNIKAIISIFHLLYKIVLIFLSVIVIIVIVIFVTVQLKYPMKVESLKQSVGNMCTLDNAWMLVKSYYHGFLFSYLKPWPKPRQFMFQGLNLEFVAKLAVVSKTGACVDFGLGTARLLNDVLGCETRVVAFEGLDHAMPEVKVGDTWFVADASYTTPEAPVKVSEYAWHLNATMPNIYSQTKRVYDLITKEDLTAEHGFTLRGKNTSN